MVLRPWLAVTAVTAVVASGGWLAPPAQAVEGEAVLNLVVIGDFHGQVDDHVVQFAATVEQLLDDAPADNTLLISAGDNVGESSVASAAQHDDPALDVLDTLGVDATAVGNHEFDHGYDDLVGHLTQRADFPFLGANVRNADGSAALPSTASFVLDGVRVAVVGAVTASTPTLTDPAGLDGLRFDDPVPAINAEVERLEALDDGTRPDVIVATVHEGAPWGTWTLADAMQSPAFAGLVDGISPAVDAIITGHGHNTYVFDTPVPGDPGRTRPVIGAGYHGLHVGQITLTVSRDTGAVSAAVARNVARVETPEADLVAAAAPTSTLAAVAAIRDQAVAFAERQQADAVDTRQSYDAAVLAAEGAQAAVESAKAGYADAVADRDTLRTTALDLQATYDAAVAAGQTAFTEAAGLKEDYLAVVADGEASYTRAAELKEQYLTLATAGKASYVRAAELKEDYAAAVAAGSASYADAAALRADYDVAMASANASYADAVELRSQYLAGLSSGTLSVLQLTAIQVDYDAAMAAAQTAYSDAQVIAADHADAVAAGQAAYEQARTIATDYATVVAAGTASYAEATTIKADYDAAVTAGTASYAEATTIKADYDAAVGAGNASYADALALKPDYDAAVTAALDAADQATLLGGVFEAAVDTLAAAIAAVDSLTTTLLSLSCALYVLCPSDSPTAT